MNDKDHKCHYCGNTLKYKGNRQFYCKKCKKGFEMEREFEKRKEK